MKTGAIEDKKNFVMSECRRGQGGGMFALPWSGAIQNGGFHG
jgi:hypothetical protein